MTIYMLISDVIIMMYIDLAFLVGAYKIHNTWGEKARGLVQALKGEDIFEEHIDQCQTESSHLVPGSTRNVRE